MGRRVTGRWEWLWGKRMVLLLETNGQNIQTMYIVWKDPNMRLHGKRHKRDSYYFRWHYGKQRMVHISCQYVDKPTDKQVSAREAFTALRREVARQLKDEKLRVEWMRKFEADNQGYKMLHTYVYAMLKGGVCVQQKTSYETRIKGVSTPYTGSELPILMLYNGVIMPFFLPRTIPIQTSSRKKKFCYLC